MDNISPQNIEERLKQLQVLELENRISLQNIEKRIKEKEARKKSFLQPATVPVFVAIIGLIGAGITSYMQRGNQLDIEDQKFRYSIYQKALEAKDNVTAARILDFYIKAELLPGEPGKYVKLLQEGKLDSLPVYSGQYRDIYKDVKLPEVSNNPKFSLSDDLVIGKGTGYMLSYNARERIDKSSLTTIVIHSAYSNDMKKTARFLADTVNGTASAHILIDRDGKVIQQVPFDYIARHAKEYNKFSIGIELINAGEITKNGEEYKTIYGSAIDASKVECNNNICWEKYTEAQINAAYDICELLVRQYNIKTIVGHYEIDAKRKKDPGPFFPMEKFKGLVK
jgi:N-acetyl-anhydromuramyl-L-alanine amidase AmpD